MTTEAIAGRILLTGFAHAGGIPVVPQPEVLDSELHRNEVVRSADGSEERRWYPQVIVDPPTLASRLLTPNQVIDLMLAVIGAAGFAACVRSDADAMVAWRYKMSVACDITKVQAAAGLSIIVASSLMTAEQRTAILASWPTA